MGRPRGGGPDTQRRSAIVLATHLIRGGALEERDEDALLGWAVREMFMRGERTNGRWMKKRAFVIYVLGESAREVTC